MAAGTTRGKRRLGRYIKPIRVRSKLSAEDVAERASCSPHTVYRLEAGDALPSRTRVAAVLAVIGASDEEREHAFALYEIADLPSAPIEHVEDLPAKYRRFRLDEGEATIERTLDTVVIPGLLQTTEYAQATSMAARRLIRTDRWDDSAGAERRERQALLSRSELPLRYHGLISEAALRWVIGSDAVMAAQLDHLLAMAALPHVTIQVIPFTSGAHGAMFGPLVLLGFDGEVDAVYVESAIGIDAVQTPEDVAALVGVWEDVASAAASPEQSVEMIKIVRKQYGNEPHLA